MLIQSGLSQGILAQVWYVVVMLQSCLRIFVFKIKVLDFAESSICLLLLNVHTDTDTVDTAV